MKIYSGGQTGADRGGLNAALAVGMEIGGWCPKGRRAEDGRIPLKYPLKETATDDYPPRTEMNVKNSSATVIFSWGDTLSRGCRLTMRLAEKHKKPYILIEARDQSEEAAASKLATFLKQHNPEILNVAGNRESKAPGIELTVERVILMALANLGRGDDT